MKLLGFLAIFIFLFTLIMPTKASAQTPACVFSPSSMTAGNDLGVIINGFSSQPHIVKIVGKVFGNVANLGSVSPPGGSVSVPSTTVAPQDYEVRVETGFGAGSDITCTGNFHVDPGAVSENTQDDNFDPYSCLGFLDCLAGIASPARNYDEEGQGLVGQIMTKILPIVLGFGVFLVVIFIVISGIQFITSSGNPEGAAAARSRLTYAIIGLILLILAFVATQVIDRLFLRSGIV